MILIGLSQLACQAAAPARHATRRAPAMARRPNWRCITIAEIVG
jgi:hypothetical protein